MIKGEEVSQIFSYTFRCGQELPSFHESTISLATETATLHEVLDIYRLPSGFAAYSSGLPTALDTLTSSDYEEWQDAIATFDDDVMGDIIGVVDDINSHSRRRSIRIPSIG